MRGAVGGTRDGGAPGNPRERERQTDRGGRNRDASSGFGEGVKEVE
jgi:hypothetical protein